MYITQVYLNYSLHLNSKPAKYVLANMNFRIITTQKKAKRREKQKVLENLFWWFWMNDLLTQLKIHFCVEIIHLARTQKFSKNKTNISYPLIPTHTRAHQWVRNISFSENFARVINE